MPLVKSQEEKSDLHVAAQPQDLSKNSVQLLMAHDLAGYGTNEIASAIGMTIGRVSVIKGSPLYKEEKARRFETLKASIVDGTSKQILEDPARKHLQEYKLIAAQKLTSLITDAKHEFIQKGAAVDVLEFGGIHKDKKEKQAGVTVVIEEKIAQRFGFAKDYRVPEQQQVVQRTISIEAA